MVAALFTVQAGLERARHQRPGAGLLSLLQIIGEQGGIRPSGIAERRGVHPSLVTRQVRELEEGGYVAVVADPADGRSCLLTLAPKGSRRRTAWSRSGSTASPCSWPTGRPTRSEHSRRC